MNQPVPSLRSVSIKGSAAGQAFLVNIQQIFVNDSGRNVEFLYTFPMPSDAAITLFSAKTARNTYTGLVEERESALEQYQEAIASGNSAFMLESHRDNIFQVSLGNVDQNETIAVDIAYLQDIKTDGSALRLVIPTLVGERYIPGLPIGKPIGMGAAPPTNEVPDADFITPVRGDTAYTAEVQVTLDLDSEIRGVTSPSHEIKTELSREKTEITAGPIKLDSDFVLNVELSGSATDKYRTADLDGEIFASLRFVPKLTASSPRKSKEYLFLIDVSGSMAGGNLESAKRALKICLRNMNPSDFFNIIAFESSFTVFAEKSVPYETTQFDAANAWVDALHPLGGTEIASALRYAIEVSVKSERERIIHLLTDGQVGNEDALIEYVRKSFEGRVFTLGIDTNVNDSFLKKLAAVGRGFAEFYYPGGGENLDKKVVKQFLRSDAIPISAPTWPDGCEFAEAPPSLLYSGESYHLFFKSPHLVNPFVLPGSSSITPTESDGNLLSKIWARKTITRMELDNMDISPRLERHARKRIAEVSKKYGVLCRDTNFIAVEERDKKFAQFPIAVNVPVEKPRRVGIVQPIRAMPITHAPMAMPTRFMSMALPDMAMEPGTRISRTQRADPRPHDISGLYDVMHGEPPHRKELLEFLRIIVEKGIDYEADFFKLDWILSKALLRPDDAVYQELLNGLKAHTSLSRLSASEIAAEQNMDGSFGYCREIQELVTAAAIQKLRADDAYIYGRQIEKAETWLKTAT